jgi:hypothetical protein
MSTALSVDMSNESYTWNFISLRISFLALYNLDTMKILLALVAFAAVDAFTTTGVSKKQTTALNNIGSKWAYDAWGKTGQENFFYHKDPNSDPWSGDAWYYQPWSFIPQPQFFPLEKTGIDMWYFEPRTVIPPNDAFFHGYNSASHMWIPPAPVASSSATTAPSAEQGAIPPAPQKQQLMPEPAQAMPNLDASMSAYDKAIAQQAAQ